MVKNSFVSMIRAQKATGREVIGTVAKVIPDNEKYAVRSIDDEAGTITLEQMLPEDSKDEPRVITITEANAVVAHYVTNPNERPAPEAVIQERNGKKVLVLDPCTASEKEVPMGSIRGLKVLGGLEGQVVFTVENQDEKLVDLMGYDVQMDKFYGISSSDFIKDAIFFASIDKDHTYVVENIIREAPVLDKDGQEQKDANGEIITEPVFVSASISRIFTGRSEDSVRLFVYRDDRTEEDGLDEYDTGYDSTEYGAPIKSVRLVEQAGRRDIVVVTESLDGNARIQLFIDENGSLGSCVGSFTVNSAEAKVFLGGSSEKPPVVTVKDKDQVLIRTGRGLLVVDDPEVVSALSGYNYFAGVFGDRDDEDRPVSTWYYANADYDVKSFTSVVTDRGTMFALV